MKLLKCLLMTLLICLPDMAGAEETTAEVELPKAKAEVVKVNQPLPEKPASRVLDQANLFEQASRDRLSRVLKTEFSRQKISVYVITVPTLDKADPTAFASLLRDAWITDKIGLIVLYNRNTDKISISLTNAAYSKISAAGKLENLANEIDKFNEEGPMRGLPKAVNAILNRLRVSREDNLQIQDKEVPKALILVPFVIVLLALGLGLWKLARYLIAQNIFTSTYILKSERVFPILGSYSGGVNTVEGKF